MTKVISREGSLPITAQDIELDIPVELGDIVQIRNGKLWGILKNSTLIYADLNVRPKPFVKVFSQLTQCSAIYVQPDGELCLVSTPKENWHIRASVLEPRKTMILPNSKVTCATYFQRDKFSVPILFIGTDQGQICFHKTSSKDMITANFIPIMIPNRQPILGMIFVPFPGELLGVCVATPTQLYPYVVDKQFLPIPPAPRERQYIAQFMGVMPGGVCSSKNQIGIWTENRMLLEFVVDTDVQPRLDTLLKHQVCYKMSAVAKGYCLFDELVLSYMDGGRAQLFSTSGSDPIDYFSIEGANMYDYDEKSGDIYAVFSRKVAKLRFDESLKTSGVESIKHWLYNACLTRGKFEWAVDIVAKMKIGFDERMKMVGNNPQMKLRLYKRMLKKIRSKKLITKQSGALAVVAFDLYARLESCEAKPDVKEFCKFTNELLEIGLLTMDTVNSTLSEYGWEEPLQVLSDPVTVFNKFMENADQDKAIEAISNIKGDADFCHSAIRVFTHDETKVCNAVMKRENLSDGRYIPILMNKQCEEFCRRLLTTGRLRSPALCRIFAHAIAEHPTRDQVETFFKEIAGRDEDDKNFMIRTLTAHKKYEMLAWGLAARGDRLGAAAAAAKEDPANAFDFIPPEMPSEDKKRAAMRVLRSLPHSDAEVLAKRVLDKYGGGIDMSTLLQFLPDEMKVADLATALAEFVQGNIDKTAEQKRNLDEAVGGINRAQKLQREREEKSLELSSTELCEKCRKPLFSERGVVFPCSHMLHMRCAEAIGEVIEQVSLGETVNVVADCPICGFLSVRTIDLPNTMPTDEVDPWTTDPELLPKLLDDTRKTVFSFQWT